MRTNQLLRLWLWAGCAFLTTSLGDGIRIASNVDLPTSSESDSKTSLKSDHEDLGLTSGIHATLDVKVVPSSSLETTKGILCVMNKKGRCIPVSSGAGGSNNNDIDKTTTKKPGPIIVSGFDDPVEDESKSNDDEYDSEDEDDEYDGDTKKSNKGSKGKKRTKVADVPIYIGLKGVTEKRPEVPSNFGPNYVTNDGDYPQQGYPDNNQQHDLFDPHYPGPPYQQPNYRPNDFYYRDHTFYQRRRAASDMPDYVSYRGRYSPETGFYSGYQQRNPGYPEQRPPGGSSVYPGQRPPCRSGGYPEQRPPGGSGGYYPPENNRGGWSQVAPGYRRRPDGYDASSWVPATALYPGLYGRDDCDSDRRIQRAPVTTTDISVDGKLGAVLEGIKA